MWRYVSQAVREGLRRGIEGRCGAAADRSGGGGEGGAPRPAVRAPPPRQQHDWGSMQLYHSCLNAFTWSGALILGWYTSQIACLRNKPNGWNADAKKYTNYQRVFFDNTKKIHSAVLSHVAFAQPPTEEMLKSFLNNDNESANIKNVFPTKKTEVIPGLEFKDVVQSIENKLGMVAVEEGRYQEGLALLKSSAEKDYAPALFNLGICFEKGLGVKQDDREALKLYFSAAGKFHPGALYNLAIFYGQGRGGLIKDPLMAKELLNAAAAKGQEEAISVLAMLNAKVEKNDTHPKVNNEPIKNESLSSTETFLKIIGCDVNEYKSNNILIY